MTGLAAELLKILQSSTCYGTKQLFSLCTHENFRTDSGERGRRMVETLERWGGEYISGTKPLHLSRGKWLWPKSTYIYGTTLVPVKKQVIR